ncbi:MAG: hypothetical protein PHC47_03540 [Clostridia bacterium]|nr:hypothetical protein [Clostridia bacterium]
MKGQYQYTIRISDSKLVDNLNKIFKDCNDLYSSQNVFMVDCLRRGVDTLERDLLGKKKLSNLDDLYTEIKTTIDKLNILLKLSEKNAKETLANLTVNQRLLSRNYNMLLGLSSNTPKKPEFVEAGMYDDLPEKLSEVLEELLKVFLNK